jgi:hypothetical protein
MKAAEKGTLATKAAQEAMSAAKMGPYADFDPDKDPYLKSIPKIKKSTGSAMDYLKGYIAGWPGAVGDIMEATEPFRAITIADEMFDLPTTSWAGP